MTTLAAAHQTEAIINGRRWVAADLTVDASGDFMTGVLGFEEQDEVRQFDPDTYSWKKGATTETHGAPSQNLVPFAIDLRDGHRWVAFATSGKIRHAAFIAGFAAALNYAVAQLNLFPSDWEVDLVTSTATIREWVATHDDVYVFTRVIRFTNPGRDLADVRAAMQELKARTSREAFEAAPGETLELEGNEEFEERIEGTETGDVTVEMKARGGDRFTTSDRPDTKQIDDFGADLDRGTDLVLRALREYVAAREET